MSLSTIDQEDLKITEASKDKNLVKTEEFLNDQSVDIKNVPIEEKIALLRKFSSDYFLLKHTASFKCFEQFLFSTSDIRLTLHYFPQLTDPGLENILQLITPVEEFDSNGVDKYLKMCKDLTIVPISRIVKSLGTDSLNLKFYGLTLKQMRGITDALKVNINVKYVNFQDNWMSPEATILISEILRESNSIRVLNLTECRIGPEGAEKLCEGIASTQFLQALDLSFNDLGDKGLKILQPCLIENTSIKKLILAHNNLTEDAAPILESVLAENKFIEELDLSWNGFNTAPGNKKLCKGLLNSFIKSLNLSWNGIGTGPSMRPIRNYLKKTEILEFLDLSWNRITKGSLRLLRGGLVKNTSLQKVKVGNNIFTPEEAYFLASFLNTAKSNISELDMENMCVPKEFLQLRNQLKRQGKVIKHGYVLSNFKIYGPNINKLLFQRCRYLAMKSKKKKGRKDFGHFVLSLPDKPVTTQEFQDILKKLKIKRIDKDLLNELMSRFVGKRKKIDCESMKDYYMKLYPDTVLPEEKKKNKKKKKKKTKK